MSRSRLLLLGTAAVVALTLGACRQDMHDQAKYEPLEASTFFANGMASRPLPEGTVPRGEAWRDTPYTTGYGNDDQLVRSLPAQALEDMRSWNDDPVEARREYLKLGQKRYQGFCQPCHGASGNGRGMIVRRGYVAAASFHEPRLVESPAGHFFDAITNGFAQMPSYAAQIPVADRWAIVAYVRVLQLSQGAPLSVLSTEERARVEGAGMLAPVPESAKDRYDIPYEGVGTAIGDPSVAETLGGGHGDEAHGGENHGGDTHGGDHRTVPAEAPPQTAPLEAAGADEGDNESASGIVPEAVDRDFAGPQPEVGEEAAADDGADDIDDTEPPGEGDGARPLTTPSPRR